MPRRRFQDDCVGNPKWFRGRGELFRELFRPGPENGVNRGFARGSPVFFRRKWPMRAVGSSGGPQRDWSRADAEQPFAFRAGRPNRGAPRQYPPADRTGRRRLGRPKRRTDRGPDRPADGGAGQAGRGARGAGGEIAAAGTVWSWSSVRKVLRSAPAIDLDQDFLSFGYKAQILRIEGSDLHG